MEQLDPRQKPKCSQQCQDHLHPYGVEEEDASQTSHLVTRTQNATTGKKLETKITKNPPQIQNYKRYKVPAGILTLASHNELNETCEDPVSATGLKLPVKLHTFL